MTRLILPLVLGLLPGLVFAQQSDDEDRQPGIAGGHRKDAFIAAYDADGDGAVGLEEYDALRKSRFDGADLDGDGALSEEEYVAEFKGRLDQQYENQGRAHDERYENSLKQASVRHAIVDRDRDGMLSWEEQQAVAASTFEHHDTDGNQVVNAADPIPEPEERDGDGNADAGDDGNAEQGQP
ncbi:hypothetical protein E0K89_014930 [Aquicoccus sp. SCR17]|nr:hypothetical protein [Carideicomes alvinocaridis]